jgi:hypothetical protein
MNGHEKSSFIHRIGMKMGTMLLIGMLATLCAILFFGMGNILTYVESVYQGYLTDETKCIALLLESRLTNEGNISGEELAEITSDIHSQNINKVENLNTKRLEKANADNNGNGVSFFMVC